MNKSDKNIGKGYVAVPTSIFDLPISVDSMVLLVYLLAYYNASFGYAYPSQVKIFNDLQIGKKKFYTMLGELMSIGALTCEQNHKLNGDFDSNHYYLDLDTVSVLEGTNYGFVAKDVLTDPEVSITAKAVYIYLASHAGAFYTATIKMKQLVLVFSSTAATLNKYKKELLQHDIIDIQRESNRANEYIILIRPTASIERKISVEIGSQKKEDTQKEDTQKENTPADNTSNGTTISNTIDNYDSNKEEYDNKSSSLLAEEDDLLHCPADDVFDILINSGDIPCSLLSDKNRLREALAYVLVVNNVSEKIRALIVDSIYKMLVQNETLIDGEIRSNSELLDLINKNIQCDSDTMWEPLLYLDEMAIKIESKINSGLVTSPKKYVESAFFNYLKYEKM